MWPDPMQEGVGANLPLNLNKMTTASHTSNTLAEGGPLCLWNSGVFRDVLCFPFGSRGLPGKFHE